VACSANSPSGAVSTTQVPCSNSTYDLRGSVRSRCQASISISVFTPVITPQSITGSEAFCHWPFVEPASSVGKPETDLKNSADTK
jgi:hypothetical protein